MNSLSTSIPRTVSAALCSSVLALAACLGGCSGVAGPGEDVGSDRQGVEDENGLAMNGLAMNGLAMNGLAMNGLLTNGLTANGISATADVIEVLDSDPLAQMFMTYLVSCALPAGQSVVFDSLAGVADYTFTGLLGVAPEWGADDGATCDQDCQQWVSACMISRVNALGQHIALSERGSNPALALVPGEAEEYPDREATYWGNVFDSSQLLYACRAVEDDQTLIGRPCGDGADVSNCAIDVLGDCHTVCATLNEDGSFADCTCDAGTFPQAVTVYRLPSP